MVTETHSTVAARQTRGRLSLRVLEMTHNARACFASGILSLCRALRPFVREPLVHFVLAGLLLFVASRFYAEQQNVYSIDVTAAHVAQLAHQYALQFGAPPSPTTLETLVERDVKDEMLYRQGLGLELDQDDEIVRRRVIQKMEFLMQDLNAPAEPSEVQLEAYYKAHMQRYLTVPRATFSHIYFSLDRAGDAYARARAALGSLSSQITRAPDRGDPFPDSYDFAFYQRDQVTRLFGHTPMSDAVFAAPVGRWSGPFRSGLGWHLVFIDERKPAVLPPFSGVRERVRADYLRDTQENANQAAFADLARRFSVTRHDRSAPR